MQIPSSHEWACADREGERYNDAAGQRDDFQLEKSKTPAHYLEPVKPPTTVH